MNPQRGRCHKADWNRYRLQLLSRLRWSDGADISVSDPMRAIGNHECLPHNYKVKRGFSLLELCLELWLWMGFTHPGRTAGRTDLKLALNQCPFRFSSVVGCGSVAINYRRDAQRVKQNRIPESRNEGGPLLAMTCII